MTEFPKKTANNSKYVVFWAEPEYTDQSIKNDLLMIYQTKRSIIDSIKGKIKTTGRTFAEIIIDILDNNYRNKYRWQDYNEYLYKVKRSFLLKVLSIRKKKTIIKLAENHKIKTIKKNGKRWTMNQLKEKLILKKASLYARKKKTEKDIPKMNNTDPFLLDFDSRANFKKTDNILRKHLSHVQDIVNVVLEFIYSVPEDTNKFYINDDDFDKTDQYFHIMDDKHFNRVHIHDHFNKEQYRSFLWCQHREEMPHFDPDIHKSENDCSDSEEFNKVYDPRVECHYDEYDQRKLSDLWCEHFCWSRAKPSYLYDINDHVFEHGKKWNDMSLHDSQKMDWKNEFQVGEMLPLSTLTTSFSLTPGWYDKVIEHWQGESIWYSLSIMRDLIEKKYGREYLDTINFGNIKYNADEWNRLSKPVIMSDPYNAHSLYQFAFLLSTFSIYFINTKGEIVFDLFPETHIDPDIVTAPYTCFFLIETIKMKPTSKQFYMIKPIEFGIIDRKMKPEIVKHLDIFAHEFY